MKRGRPPKRRIEEEGESEAPPPQGTGAVEGPSGREGAEPPQTASAGPEVESGAPPPQDRAQAEGAVDGEHTCSECGMTFQRRYALIMHTLKHEKARGYKCSVSIRLGHTHTDKLRHS